MVLGGLRDNGGKDDLYRDEVSFAAEHSAAKRFIVVVDELHDLAGLGI